MRYVAWCMLFAAIIFAAASNRLSDQEMGAQVTTEQFREPGD